MTITTAEILAMAAELDVEHKTILLIVGAKSAITPAVQAAAMLRKLAEERDNIEFHRQEAIERKMGKS